MTSLTLPIHSAENWQSQLSNSVNSGDQLLSLLDLKASDVGLSDQACRDFALKVPRSFVRRMQPGNPADPLLLQVLANERELEVTPGFGDDPVGEFGEANNNRGIIQKYHGRALLIVSGSCAINCRYCFRRHFPYADHQNSRSEWQYALQNIADDPTISEVILSGGDPLLPGDNYLAELVEQIASIAHVRRLRIHSRLPVVIPERITEGLIEAICRDDIQTIMVIHSNHGNEIDLAVSSALAMLNRAGIIVLNQAVLLRGVNDNASALIDLSEQLFAAGALPYYLHLLDKVQGAAHFDVPEMRARALVGEISAQLPGYLVPRLVREIAGARSKIGVPALYGEAL